MPHSARRRRAHRTSGPPRKLALILGAEGPGLPDALLARGQAVRIPMIDGVDSVNVATAGAIALSSVFQDIPE